MSLTFDHYYIEVNTIKSIDFDIQLIDNDLTCSKSINDKEEAYFFCLKDYTEEGVIVIIKDKQICHMQNRGKRYGHWIESLRSDIENNKEKYYNLTLSVQTVNKFSL